MNKDKALKIVKEQLTLERYDHTKRVLETALSLNQQLGLENSQIELAAIFHDYAKYRDKNELKKMIIDNELPTDLLEHHSELWHGPAGALLVSKEVCIKDQEVLSAIRWHTTGTRNMSELEKLIFIADYIEPYRNFSGVEEVRGAARVDIDRACWLAARNTIEFLLSKQQMIYPDTLHLYNEGVKREQGRQLNAK
ncbi:bis(5'-nucleosyl)-tetraphosphatase (symmetrical) YqeK [Saliterribacillus persicus]|uniref:bis(5'-nucleosyl)-tetraphosphatase (symmetrical) n=1 Tax=Saliterribacillus persicus TaxID=930114 RepID=A0A368XC62_9BACI|nr:bis(5'-nucleosyl)-tetraphosphatase (symmetrical) YqeK [Saliterribacillus persicus]RCW65299.1 putative HD superfamily hydrolase involved in NAD metabolism [Saliterribacillus persicus]